MQPILPIFELEELLTQHENLMIQEQQSYPPFLFMTCSSELGHYLLLHQPDKKIFCRFHYTYSRTRKCYAFLDLIIKNENTILGKIHSHSRSYKPPQIACDIDQLITVNDDISIRYYWDTWDGKLNGTELITDGVSYPKDTDLGEIKNLENQLGINFPWQIDPSEKVQEILDLTGYKQFFDILVSQTPCGICMTTKSDHNETTGHEYKPFQIYDANNTFCLVCNKPMKNHGSDHQFKPKFIPYHFKELKQPFVNI